MSEKESVELLSGVWTPWAQVLCHECHGNEGPRRLEDEQFQKMLEPRPLQPGNAQTFCDGCGVDVQVSRGLAAEHNLVRELREQQGIDAVMAQTGGMMSACLINVAPELRKPARDGELGLGEVLVTCNDMGQDEYNVGVYDADFGPASVTWGNVTLQDLDEVRGWVSENRSKLHSLDAVQRKQPEKNLDQLVKEAKEKASEKVKELGGKRSAKTKGHEDREF